MYRGTRLGLALSAVAVAVIVACSNSVTGEATAPTNVRPFTTTTTTTTTATTTTTTTGARSGGSDGLPPQAYEEIRNAGVEGPDTALSDLVGLACIMADSSFNDSVQDVVDVLIQMGSTLRPEQLDVVVRTAVKYECPEQADELGI